MTVTLQTAIYQPGQTADVTTGQMRAVVYANGHTPAYDDGKMDAIVHRWAFWSDTFGFLRSVTWGQSGHETGWFWSRVEPNQVQPDQHNFGGLGADNTGASGGTFIAIDDLTAIDHGIVAFMAHLCLYVHGEPHQWPSELQKYAKYAYRLDAVRNVERSQRKPDGSLLGYLGVVAVIGDFVNCRWAHSSHLPCGTLDNGYAHGIVAKANEVHAQPIKEEEPMAGDDPRFAWVPDTEEYGYPKGTPGRGGEKIELLVIHITQGTDSLGWLTGNNQNSAHYLTDQSFRPRVQMVLERDAAWAAGSKEFNQRGVQLEFEILKNTPISDAQFREAAKTAVPILRRNDIQPRYLGRNHPRGTTGIIGHSDVPDPDGTGWGGSGNHTDPGDHWDWDKFIGYIQDELGMAVVPTVPTASRDPWRDSNPYSSEWWIPNVLIDYINDRDWMEFGYCVSEMFVEGNGLVQYFERARLELDSQHNVTRGLVGREVLYGKYPERVPD